MEKAFSEEVVQSSNIDEYNSSELEDDYLKLNKDDLKRSLKSIPVFIKNHDVDDEELNGCYIIYIYIYMYTKFIDVLYYLFMVQIVIKIASIRKII